MYMRVFVLNSGSSSLKFQLLDMPGKNLIAKGLVERIGEKEIGALQIKIGSEKTVEEASYVDHSAALSRLFTLLGELLGSEFAIDAVGHRVVHGGEIFPKSTLLDAEAIAGIDVLKELAPLHNPAHLMGIRACETLLPGVPQVACFDTSFHTSLTPSRYLYPLPHELYETYKIRRYGFHGISHDFVSARVAEMTGAKKIIVAHIGNGASITAVENGKSVDTSMGFTPLEGLMMGTRCGSIDPAVCVFLARKGMSADEIDTLMNKKSGVLGVFEKSGDLREIEDAFVAGGDAKADLAMEMYTERIAKTIASYAVSMNGIEAIAFTAGVGENSGVIRGLVMDKLAFLGVRYNKELNGGTRGKEIEISTADSAVKAFVIPTDEEGKIAEETFALCA